MSTIANAIERLKGFSFELSPQMRLTAKRLLLLVLVYFMLRLVFIAFNFLHFKDVTWGEWVIAFGSGLRFDLAAILWLNLPFLLLWHLPWNWQKSKVFSFLAIKLCIITNCIFVAANVIDMELANFNGRRLTMGYLQLSQDIGNQLPQLAYHYWGLALIALGLFIYLFWGFGKLSKWGAWPAIHPLVRSLEILLALPILILGLRGGVQSEPLTEAHVYGFDSPNLEMVAQNSTFTLLKSLDSKSSLPKIEFMAKRSRPRWVVSNYNRRPTPAFAALGPKTNVVVIVVESLALEYMGKPNGRDGYTPFLDQLTEEALFFKNNFANGRRSIEAIPSILCGLPSLMTSPFIMSRYQENKIVGLGEMLKRWGYHTSFFHGGENGTMFFDSFSYRAGFDNYFGMKEYPKAQNDFDGYWGIYDEPFYKFTVDKLSSFKEPFATAIFSLSSHQPYRVPEEYEDRFPKGELEVHQSIGYADYALSKFFEWAKQKDWYERTLFVITADHTQKSVDPVFQNHLGPYRVPLFFYYPSGRLPVVTNMERVTEHVDVVPSVLDLLGIQGAGRTVYGQSVFSNVSGFAVNYNHSKFWYVDNSHFVEISPSGTVQAFQHQEFQLFSPVPNSSVKPAVLLLKATVQDYYDGLIANDWYQ